MPTVQNVFQPSSTSVLPYGESTTARLIRSLHWPSNPLGSIEDWTPTQRIVTDLLLSSAYPMIALWGPELIQIYNDGYLDLMGNKHPAGMGQPTAECWPEVWAFNEPIYQRVWKGETITFQNQLFPIRRHGFLEDAYFSLCYSPIYDESHAVVGVLVNVVETTERLRAEKQLVQVMKAINDGVAYIDRDWRITYLNDRGKEILSASGDVLGRNHWEVFPAALDEGAPFVSAYNRAMQEGISSHFEFHYPDPLNIWFQANCEPASDGIVVFFRDVTKERQTQHSLLQSEKLAVVGRLSASIAHEINNPLESVTNLLYLMRTNDSVDELHTYVDTAEQELRRISRITSQTLRFYKQSTKATPEFCYDLIGDSLAVFQGRLVNNTISVEKKKRAKHPVECLGGEIRQVIGNLIGNAIDAMPSGGRLLLRSREATNHLTGRRGLVVTVADTGVGIPPDVQKKVFDAFYTTKGIGGTGLGLWISSEIVSRHGGTLRFRSCAAPGKSGTVFNLFLPFMGETIVNG